jgi:ribosomal protein L30
VRLRAPKGERGSEVTSHGNAILRSDDEAQPLGAHRLGGLGLRRIGKTVYLKDTPAVRGMIYKVVDMVNVVPKSGTLPPSKREQVRQYKKSGKAKQKKASAQA